MKKTKKIALIVFCLFFMILCIIAAYITSVILQYNRYVFSSEICKLLLEKNPYEFCESSGAGTLLENGYTFAKVDEEGNLILILNDTEKENWKDSVLDDDWISLSAKNAGNFVISKDYTKITLKCYKETYLNELTSFTANALDCIFLQAIEGKKSEDIIFEAFFVDAVTNEVKYHVVLPNANLKFTIDPNSFSSKEQAQEDTGSIDDGSAKTGDG